MTTDKPPPHPRDSTLVGAAGSALPRSTDRNRCDGCDTPELPSDTALCGKCADDAWDRWLDRHDDIGPDE